CGLGRSVAEDLGEQGIALRGPEADPGAPERHVEARALAGARPGCPDGELVLVETGDTAVVAAILGGRVGEGDPVECTEADHREAVPRADLPARLEVRIPVARQEREVERAKEQVEVAPTDARDRAPPGHRSLDREPHAGRRQGRLAAELVATPLAQPHARHRPGPVAERRAETARGELDALDEV